MENEKMLSIAKFIKTRRKHLGITQEKMAKLTGYSDRSSITKIESGKVDLSQSKIMEFAKALKVSPIEIINAGNENNQNNILDTIKNSDVVLTPEQEIELNHIIEHNILFFKKNKIDKEYAEKLADILREFYIETLEEDK